MQAVGQASGQHAGGLTTILHVAGLPGGGGAVGGAEDAPGIAVVPSKSVAVCPAGTALP